MRNREELRQKIAAAFKAEKANPRSKVAAFPADFGDPKNGSSELPQDTDDAGGGSGKRNIPKDHPYDPKALKPMAKTLWASSVALGHALTAYRHMSRLKSSTISPDGMLGGRGYIRNIADLRKSLYDACESLSAITDTLHDEINAPHWQPRLAELDPAEAEDIERFVEESQDILDNPEEEAEAEAQEIENQSQDAAKDQDAGVDESQFDDSEDEVPLSDEDAEDPEAGLEDQEADAAQAEEVSGNEAEGDEVPGDEVDGEDEEIPEGDDQDQEAFEEDVEVPEGDEDADSEGEPLQDHSAPKLEGVPEELPEEVEEDDPLFEEDQKGSDEEDLSSDNFYFGDPQEVADAMAELDSGDTDSEETSEDTFEENDSEEGDSEEPEDEETPEAEDEVKAEAEEEAPAPKAEEEEEEPALEDGEENEDPKTALPSLNQLKNKKLKKKTKIKKASENTDTMDYDYSTPGSGGGPRVEDRALEETYSINPAESFPGDDWGTPSEREYDYTSPWENDLHEAGSSVPDSSSDPTPTEAWDFGLGYGAKGEGAGGYENPSGEGNGTKGVYGPHSGIPGTIPGSSGDNPDVLDRVNERRSQGKLPNDNEPPVARSDYYQGDRGNLVNSQTSLPGETTVPGEASPGLLNTDYVTEDVTTPYVRYDYTTHSYREDPLHDWVDNK